MPGRTPHPVKAVIVMRGMTITEAADDIDVSPDVLRRWLNRHERMPLARRRQLADALGWDDLADLFHDDAPEPRATTTEDTADAR